ncbi:sulfatase-like hydrolase/transferase [Methyloterricola oryzae]|uniref:sulfatase-like hydrolase/transferase n=1 Tax=Methyloterricola oryzae TaxID=1495050 RepID=UPI0009E1BD04|nr:sulfatase-like hydrolase/transferase [Methyloterricola oryzae]
MVNGKSVSLVEKVLLGGFACALGMNTSAEAPAGKQSDGKPNIVIIWGDDIGQSNVSAYSRGVMGYKTPNIDRVAAEGMMFTDYYAEQSCTATKPAARRSRSIWTATTSCRT